MGIIQRSCCSWPVEFVRWFDLIGSIKRGQSFSNIPIGRLVDQSVVELSRSPDSEKYKGAIAVSARCTHLCSPTALPVLIPALNVEVLSWTRTALRVLGWTVGVISGNLKQGDSLPLSDVPRPFRSCTKPFYRQLYRGLKKIDTLQVVDDVTASIMF